MADSKATAKSLSTCDYNSYVTVRVGPTEQSFIVHRDIICAKSKFFQAACSERWLNSTEADKKIKLPEVDPRAFQQYLTWIYSGELDLSSFMLQHIKVMTREPDRNVARYSELYLLGDVLDDLNLRNTTMRALVLDTHHTPLPSVAHRVWNKTPENSRMRKMFVDRAIMVANRDFLRCNLTRYPTDFVQQCALLLLRELPVKAREFSRPNCLHTWSRRSKSIRMAQIDVRTSERTA